MNRLTAMVPATLVALVAPLGVGHNLAEEFRTGDKTAHRFTLSMEGGLDNMEMSMNGESFPMEMEMAIAGEAGVSWTEEVLRTDADTGSRTAIRFTFGTLQLDGEAEMEMSIMGGNESESETFESTGPLEDAIVEVRRDEDGEIVREVIDGNDVDEEILEYLDLDSLFAGLLPGRDVDIDDSWELEDAAAIGRLFAVFGLAIDPDEMGDEGDFPGSDSDFGDILTDSLTSGLEITCTLISVEDGVAEISIEIEGDLSLDDLDIMDLAGEDIPEEMGDIEIDMALSGNVSAEGTMNWSLERNRLQDLDLSGEMGVSYEMSTLMVDQGMEQEMAMDFSMDLEMHAECGAPSDD